MLHGAGVGGGSLGYANVLMEPGDEAFDSPAWRRPVDWGRELRPHYATAKTMLGVTDNPKLWAGRPPAAADRGRARARATASGRCRWAPSSASRAGRASRSPIRTSAARGRHVGAASTAAAAWWAAGTTPRTRCPRTTSTSPRSGERRSIPDATVRDIRPLAGHAAGRRPLRGALPPHDRAGAVAAWHPAPGPQRDRLGRHARHAAPAVPLPRRHPLAAGDLRPGSATMVRTNNEALLGSVRARRATRLLQGHRDHLDLPRRRSDHHRAGALSRRLTPPCGCWADR